MARDDNDSLRVTPTARARVWRVGEQRLIIGDCLQYAFSSVNGNSVDADIARLLEAIASAEEIPS